MKLEGHVINSAPISSLVVVLDRKCQLDYGLPHVYDGTGSGKPRGLSSQAGFTDLR